jgi:hypothetical protein
MKQSKSPVQAPFTAACYGAGSMVVDKTGTIFQVWTGRLTNPGAWGPHVFRTVPGGKPELVWFMEGANGTQLMIMNKELWLSYTPPRSGQWGQPLDGFIDPSDTPSSQIVNVDESALNAVKASVRTAQSLAENALANAKLAQSRVDGTSNLVNRLQAQVDALTAKVNNMSAQQPNQNVIADIVWAKLWDAIYILRTGMNVGTSTDPNVNGWINDLTNFIKKVK